MNLRDAIALHAPDHKHLIGVVPDDELAAYVNEGIALRILQDAVEVGMSIDELKSIAKTERNWTAWTDTMRKRIAEESGE